MSKPTIESIKEVSRWVVLFVVGWIITETLKQIGLVPEFAPVKIWIFAYLIPIRAIVQSLLMLSGRYIDKYLFVKDKVDPLRLQSEEPRGLIPF